MLENLHLRFSTGVLSFSVERCKRLVCRGANFKNALKIARSDDKLDQFKKQVSGVKMCVCPGKNPGFEVKCPVKGSFLVPV